MLLAERMRRFAGADLYVVITEAFCDGRPALTVLDAVLEAGVRLVQLREKDCAEEHDACNGHQPQQAAPGPSFFGCSQGKPLLCFSLP